MRVNCARPVNCDPPRDDLAKHHSGATLALLSYAMLIVSLDQYIVVVALPDIGRDLGYSSQTLQSVISAYAVASSGFLLFGGRAADLLGQRRMLATGLVLYASASLAGGLATGAEVQLTARAVQGLGGALVFPSTLAVINTTFAEGRDRNRALGIWGGAGAAGLVVGPWGTPFRHAVFEALRRKPFRRRRWTTSSAMTQYGPRQYATMSVSTVRLLRQRVDELETVNRIRRSQRLTMAMPVKHHHRRLSVQRLHFAATARSALTESPTLTAPR